MNAAAQFGLNQSLLAQFFSIRTDHMRKIGILTGGLLIGAASLSANAGSLISSTQSLDYQLPDAIQKMCAERENCPEIEVKYLESSHEWINEIANARIDTLVINSKPTESATTTKKSSQADVTTAIDDFATSQFQDMPKDVSWAYSLMVTPEYLGHVNEFELFEIDTYVFTGGAHGMPYSEYLIFDLGTKKQITLDDMLQAGKKPRFEALAYDAYKAWVKTVSDDVSSYEKSWPFTLSENVTLTDKGVDIRYQHYSIGPYAYGMPVLSIPYSKLDNVIKPHFLSK